MTGTTIAPTATPEAGLGARERARAYFLSDTRRCLQTALGILWLLDGLLQLQPFMYSAGFPAVLRANAAGQAGWLHASLIWGANLAQGHLTLFDTAFATIQVLIGLSLLYRPTVRLAILVSCGWAVVVWWFGEAFGMLLMTMAAPLTGAPGAVILYALIGLVVWPGQRPGWLMAYLLDKCREPVRLLYGTIRINQRASLKIWLKVGVKESAHAGQQHERLEEFLVQGFTTDDEELLIPDQHGANRR